MYKHLHSKNFYDEETNLEITIALIPSLKDLEVFLHYIDIAPKTFGTDVEMIITDERFLRTISPLTGDYLAVLLDNELSIYITDYTNSNICINEDIDKKINTEYKKVQEEYQAKRKADIRLFKIDYDNMWLTPVTPYDTVTELMPCLLDKSFESPKISGYVFGNLKKTIIDKRKNQIDIIEPISVYIRHEAFSISKFFEINYKNSEDILLSILDSITNQNLDYTTLYRIFYHYAKKDKELMEIYTDKIFKKDNKIPENIDYVLSMYREDVLRAFKTGIDEIIKIYNIIATPQPTKNVPYCVNISDSKLSKKFNSTDTIKLYFLNNEIEYVKVEELDPLLCHNYNIIHEKKKFRFVKK